MLTGCLGLSALALPRHATAEDISNTTVARERAVEARDEVWLGLRCESKQRDALMATLAPGLDDLELRPTWQVLTRTSSKPSLAPSAAQTLAMIWVHCVDSRHVRLTLLDGHRQRVFTRYFELERGLDAVALELIAFVVQSSLDSLAQGKPIGLRRTSTSAAEALAVATRDTDPSATTHPGIADGMATGQSSAQLGWSAQYELQLATAEQLTHGVALGVQRGRQRVIWHASLALSLPFDVESEGVRGRFESLALRLGAGWAASWAPNWEWATLVGVGIEATHVAASADAQTEAFAVETADAFWTRTELARMSLLVHWRLEGWSLRAEAGIDWRLRPDRFNLELDGTPTPVFEPWRVRPVLGLGVAF